MAINMYKLPNKQISYTEFYLFSPNIKLVIFLSFKKIDSVQLNVSFIVLIYQYQLLPIYLSMVFLGDLIFFVYL